jgi:hypothetical protein
MTLIFIYKYLYLFLYFQCEISIWKKEIKLRILHSQLCETLKFYVS